MHIDTVHGSYTTNHADDLQIWGGPNVLQVDRFTGYTSYQGLFLQPTQFGDTVPTLYDLRHVDIHGDNNGGNTSGYQYYSTINNLPLSTSNVFADAYPSYWTWKTLMPDPGNPGEGQGYNMWAGVQLGSPSGGNFVPPGVAGLNYVSPGYDNFDYEFNTLSFGSHTASTSGMSLQGSATLANGSLQLTGGSNQDGTVWTAQKQAVKGGFRSEFEFQVTNPGSGGGDGFAFVVQNMAANAMGSGGTELGFGNAISNSVAIAFHIGAGTADNSVSIQTRGESLNSTATSASIGEAIPASVLMDDGKTHQVEVLYGYGQLQVYLDDMSTPLLDVPFDVDSLGLDADGSAWAGFTSGTDTAYQTQDISDWSFSSGANLGSEYMNPEALPEPSSAGLTLAALLAALLWPRAKRRKPEPREEKCQEAC